MEAATTFTEKRTTDLPAVEMLNLSKSYGPNRALEDVSLTVQPGSIHALLGGNGSGKSTLIKCLAGVVSADGGTFRTPTREWHAQSQTPDLAKQSHFRFVHQQNTTFADLTVAENLGIGGTFKRGAFGRISWSQQRRHAQDVLDRFHIPADPRDSVEKLGAAVQMLIAIARAMQDSDHAAGGVLVLDEPTASLPRTEVDLLLSSLQGLVAGGQSILLVSHRLAEIERIADEATVLRDGRVVSRLDRENLSQDDLVRAITGKSETARAHPLRRKGGSVVLRYEPDDGSLPLELRAGECVGIAGLLSSGRSNLLKRIFGALPRGNDVLTVADTTVPQGCSKAAMRAGIALVPEDRPAEALFPDMNLTENTSIANLGPHVRGLRVDASSERRKAEALIADFGVKAATVNLPLSALSGGNQQKVILARWMQRNPKVLLLDEPTQGIDIGAREEIHNLIARAVREGLSVLYVSSDFEELSEVSDRVVVVKSGRLVGEVAEGQINEEDLYQHVFAKESLS
ncbi:sugar ABC transporter ATP-binding protein (plasmid) [Rhodococcus opacus]|uniref:sugar ABC transporter ATP-binding protein n=1 Tax=Rhodococcus opacus TaxID=37919 RepID=UPI0034D23285